MSFDPIPLDLIERQVLMFMAELDISPKKDISLIIDGQKHRYQVVGDKGGETSAQYRIYPDNLPAGFLWCWRSGIETSWKFDVSELAAEHKNLYQQCRTKEFIAKSREAQKKREDDEKRDRLKNSDMARIKFQDAAAAPEDHPYLVKKQAANYGLKIQENALIVPIRDVDGNFMTLQYIMPDGSKRFFPGAPVSGGFFSIGLDALDKGAPILLCEGYATGATLYELTGCAVICAMNCGNMLKLAPVLRKKYPENKIIIMADDDAKTQGNPGITKANEAAKAGNFQGVYSPPFKSPDDGSDWNDFAVKYGAEAAGVALKERIKWACMSDEEREEFKASRALDAMCHSLDKNIQLPPDEFIGGMFPKGDISMVVAGTGIGKTWFLQKFVSDLSIGGAIFDGFAYEAEPKLSLVFAGEAGYKRMIHRAAETQWPVNTRNVPIYSMIECEQEGISLALDEEDGRRNIELLLKKHNPHIVFFDTLSSFHSSDENKSMEMKPIFKYLLGLARDRNIAVVLMHHTRKRKIREQRLPMSQDEVIGSSISNRLVSLIIGIEPIQTDADIENDNGGNATNLVKVLKTWFTKFPPFTYKITDGADDRTTMEIDLNPKQIGSVKNIIWEYIERTYEPGVWFKAGELKGAAAVSRQFIHRCLNELTKQGKLKQRGEKKGAEYCLLGFYEKSFM